MGLIIRMQPYAGKLWVTAFTYKKHPNTVTDRTDPLYSPAGQEKLGGEKEVPHSTDPGLQTSHISI